MKRSNFALRVQPSLLDEARKVAAAEGVALNQLINVALAEKLSALRTASYFAERAARADIPEALRILDRAGVGEPPVRVMNRLTQCQRGARDARALDASSSSVESLLAPRWEERDRRLSRRSS